MERKQNDLFIDTVASPNASYLDFVNVGYTPENTSLLDISVYRNNDWVRDQFKDQYGNFDEAKFQETYNTALSNYNNLAVEDRSAFLRSQISYHRDNIFAPRELRRQGPDYYEVKMVNPLRQVYGLTTLGRVEDPTMSIDEIALSNKVLANPTTAGADLSNAKWEDTPNGNFTKYFWDTLVIAQYDEDGEHIDPVTGEKIKHSKGEFKLNEDGEFYYEKLDGRSIYGRLVLNKANILTVDGSKMNKYDFFDSDDLELKSIGGSLLKNAALVGSMFLPYIGPAVLTATIATELVGIGAVFGKMIAGSDSPTLSAIEGWSASLDRRRAKTQYAQEHPWCWESFITMIGDFTEIGATLRFLFTKIPKLIMGEDLMTEAGLLAKLKELTESEKTLRKAKIKDLLKDSVVKEGKKNYQILRSNINELRSEEIISAMAQAKLLPLIKDAQTIGHALSKGYMALSIANDTYGEAKAEGASDMDATLLTLGYTAGVWKFLNAGVSQWIFPELRVEGYRAKAIAKALVSKDKETENLLKLFGSAIKSFDKKAKKDYVKKVFNIGKKIANAEYANGTKTLSATVASAVGMGVEGVGFEFLSDLSKGCYDVVKWLQGSNHRLDAFGYHHENNEWNPTELISSYGMNFLSAVIGGSITGLFSTYNQLRALNNVTHLRAIQELIYMSRNGLLSNFLKQVDKMELGNKYLSATEFNETTKAFTPGTETNNQDLFNKLAIHMLALLIDDILNANGANISDESFLDILTLKELRLAILLKSSMAGLYLNEYNTKLARLVEITSRLNERNMSKQDLNKDGAITDTESRKKTELSTTEIKEINDLLEELSRLANEINELVSGKRSYEYIRRSLYEMTGIISGENSVTSLELWCYANYGKRYEDLSNTDKAEALSKYETWLHTEGREITRDAADIFHLLQVISNETIAKLFNEYHNSEAQLEKLSNLNKALQRILLPEAQVEGFDFTTDDVLDSQFDAENWINFAQKNQGRIDKIYLTNLRLIEILGSEENKARILTAMDEYNESLENINNARDEKKSEDEINNLEIINNVKLLNLITDIQRISKYNIENYIDEIMKVNYASTEVKNLLTNVLNGVRNITVLDINDSYRWVQEDKEYILNFNEELVKSDEERLKELMQDIDYYLTEINEIISNRNSDYDRLNRIDELITKLNNLPESPLVHNLEEFLKLVSNNDRLSISGVLKEVNDIYNKTTDNITNFKLEGDLLKRLAEVLSIMRLYRSSIVAARTDNAGLNNYFGYNATLNEVAEKNGMLERLVELDKESSDVFIEDLTNNINKLEYLNKLNLLNLGLKLSAQSRIDTRKNIIIYKRVNQIFNVSDDDPLNKWEGLSDLQNVINGMTTHQELIKNNIFITNKENEEAFEREKISLEDAINDFFRKNVDKDLHELINGNRFNLLDYIDDTLDETTENFSDNSIVWWLCSKAALKASDFYSLYLEIINSDVIPLSTQEIGIYHNYASIVNGNMYTKFKEVYSDAVTTQWKSLSVTDRMSTLNKIAGFEVEKSQLSNLCSDSMADYCINFLPSPLYANFILNEGIAGAGKSFGVLPLTLSLLKKFHPEILLNIIILHGGNRTRALELYNSLGLKDVKGVRVLGPQEWREYIGIDKEVPSIDTKTRQINVPEGKVGTTGKDNALTPRITIRSFRDDEKPKLIIVDEILRLNWFDLESLLRVAEKFGISVLGFGDYDLSGIKATTDLNIGSAKLPFNLGGERTSFARIPKMGVSMRTNNIIKTRNLNAMRLYMHTPKEKRDTTHFEYMINEKGLFGDRVITYDDPGTVVIDPDFKTIIDTLVKTKKEGEKIGYISNVKDYESPILKYILDNYNDAFELKTMDAASGDEATYYIIDIDNDNDLSDIYTGMTRAELGSVILMNAGETKLSDKKVNFNIDEPLSEASKQQYAKKRYELLSKIVKPGAKIDIIPRGTSETVINSSKSTPDDVLDTTNDPNEKPPTPGGEPPTPGGEPPTPGGEPPTPGISGSNEELPPPPTDATPLKPNVSYGESGPTSKIPGQEGNLFSFEEEPTKPIKPESEPTSPENKSELKSNTELSLFSDDDFPENFLDLNLGFTGDPGVIDAVQDDINSKFINTTGGLKPVDAAKLELDNYNIDDTQTPSIEAIIEDIGNSYSIREIISTFNSFGLGLIIEGDHFVAKPLEGASDPNIDIKAFKVRIDNANGLLKILFGPFTGNTIEEFNEYLSTKSVKNTEKQIGFIQSILYNGLSKSQICSEIKAYIENLNPNFDSGDGLFVDFAFKLSPHSSERNRQKNRAYVEKDVTAFCQHMNEKSKFSWTTEEGSDFFSEKKFVAIIGKKVNGKRLYILEIPLAIMNSPLTLMQAKTDGKEVFAEVRAYFESICKELAEMDENRNGDEVNMSIIIPQAVKKVIEKFGDNVKYKNLINRFKVFDFGYRDITFIATNRDGKLISINLAVEEVNGTNNKKYDGENPINYYEKVEQILEGSDWVPFKNLELLGARLVRSRGMYQIIDLYHYEAKSEDNYQEWTTIKEYADNPRSKVTNVYLNTLDAITINGKQIEVAKKGHAFVLVSHDLEIDNDTDIIDYYIKLLVDPTILRKVELIYVLPPHATVREYLDNLRYIFTTKMDDYTKKLIKPIGLLFTSFRIWEKLLFGNNQELTKRVIKRLLDKGYDEEGIIKEISDKLLQLRGLTNHLILDELTDTNFVKQLRELHTEANRKYKLPNANTKLSAYLDYLLLELTCNENDNGLILTNEGVSMLESIMPGVYYNVKILNDAYNHMGLSEVARSKDGYMIDGKPFQINGKIETYIFRGNLDPIYLFFIDDGIEFTTKGNAVIVSSLALSYYLDHIDNNEAPVKTLETPTTPGDLATPTSEEITHLKFNNKNTIPINRILEVLKIDKLEGSIRMFKGELEINDLKEIRKGRSSSYDFTLRINGKNYDASFINKRDERKLDIKDENCNTFTIKL